MYYLVKQTKSCGNFMEADRLLIYVCGRIIQDFMSAWNMLFLLKLQISEQVGIMVKVLEFCYLLHLFSMFISYSSPIFILQPHPSQTCSILPHNYTNICIKSRYQQVICSAIGVIIFWLLIPGIPTCDEQQPKAGNIMLNKKSYTTPQTHSMW